MKVIIVQWVPEKEFGYGKAMRVIKSDHKRFLQELDLILVSFMLLLMKALQLFLYLWKKINKKEHKSW